jgi:glutamate-5-semialdehyde dehydrogenase
MSEPLTVVEPGMAILFDGNRVTRVSPELAKQFRQGDRLLVLGGSGDLLHIPAAVSDLVAGAVGRAHTAFQQMSLVAEAAITDFYASFAAALADDAVWGRISEANEADLAAARARGRSTTRLAADEKMRRDMIGGLEEWRALPSPRGTITATIAHQGWRVEQVLDGLGVVGFVFEGRPNVFADATGVLRSGNTAVLRIGGDALATARAIEQEALRPALLRSGLPDGAITLIDSPEHAAGWALFADRRLALAVARGSGRAVTQLGAVARQAGVPVSLHGTGGAWIVAHASADPARLEAAVYHSLDRKVCNTANVLLLSQSQAPAQLSVVLSAVRRRGEALGTGYKLHVLESAMPFLPTSLFAQRAPIRRAAGTADEPVAEVLPLADLSREWEWEATPELTLGVAASLDEAVDLFNRYSPRFAASLIAEDQQAQQRFFAGVDAPFVGNGFTRWVDGQYALSRPELGLSNWQGGRLLGRGGILSGDSVFTVRLRVVQDDPTLHR